MPGRRIDGKVLKEALNLLKAGGRSPMQMFFLANKGVYVSIYG